MNSLKADQSLKLGDSITSNNGDFRLVMQNDGNFVLYNRFDTPMWASNTEGKGGVEVIMQDDGNLVIYKTDPDDPDDHAPVWASNTNGKGGVELVLQDEGNAVICDGDGKPVWATNLLMADESLFVGESIAPHNGAFKLIMQGDGNLVLYNLFGKPTWASKTEGKGGVEARMQGDGNLVIYKADHMPVWSTNTAGSGGVELVVQDDGNAVICTADGKPVWASQTACAPTWMQDNLGSLGKKTLSEICITGSHDSGMYVFNSKPGSTLASPCNTLTQSHSIFGQLYLGARYFDIRPVFSGDHLYAGHYSNTPIGYMGANGASIDDIVSDINGFTSKAAELIILNLSHVMDTDNWYSTFSTKQWDELFHKLSGLNNLYVADPATMITDTALNTLIGQGKSAVVVIAEQGGDHLGAYRGNGFYPGASCEPYNKYSESNDLNHMMNDQTQKMNANYGKYFLLSWTLTQSKQQIEDCFKKALSKAASDAARKELEDILDRLGLSGLANLPSQSAPTSIRDLADEANQHLSWLEGCITPQNKPNIIYIDNIKDNYASILAMKINNISSGYEGNATLGPDQSLMQGQSLVSPNGAYRLVMQNDGNLVMYNIMGIAMWASNTEGKGGVEVIMQDDGNLVMYKTDPNDPDDHAPVWASNTNGKGGVKFVLQDKGNAVICAADGKPVWATNLLMADESLFVGESIASINGTFKLVMQSDGNLVLYNPSGKPTWASKTEGKGGVEARMQGDGNLVIYDANHKAVWDTNTAGSGGIQLFMQDDGNAVVYTADGKPVWASQTA